MIIGLFKISGLFLRLFYEYKRILSQTVDNPYTSRIGLLNLSRSAALPFSPSGAGLNEPSTARARLFFIILIGLTLYVNQPF